MQRGFNCLSSEQVGVGQVIRGWDEGCLSMRLGEIAVLTVHPTLLQKKQL
jgi:FKBP-type peptidyl-prolyl cis-trans isomerase